MVEGLGKASGHYDGNSFSEAALVQCVKEQHHQGAACSSRGNSAGLS